MRLTAPGIVFLAGFSLVGCGGESKAPPKTPVPAATEGPQEPLEQAVDLSPVSAPKDLVLTGRLSRPLHAVDTVTRWAGLPLSVRQLLPSEMKWVDELVVWDAPVQMAGVLVSSQPTPGLDLVVTIGLASADRTVAALREQGMGVERMAPGVFRVTEGESEEANCAVAVARGAAPARLVCSPEWESVERLLPYATRGLPDLPASNVDLEIDFNPEPLQRVYAQQISSLKLLSGFAIRQLSIDHAGFDRALGDAVYALADEGQVLANDLDRVRLEGKIDEPGSAIDLAFLFKLKSDKSWTGQTLKEMSQRSGPAPEAFWQLPDQSTAASYVYPTDPARLRPILRTLADLADGFLDHEKVGRASRDKVKNAIMDLASTSAGYVQADGQVPSTKVVDPSAADLFAQFLGWQLLVIDGPAEPQLKALKGLHAVLNDREIRKLAGKHLDIEQKLLPTTQMKPFAGKGIPAGGTAFVVNIPPELVDEHPSLFSGLMAKPEKAAKVAMLRCVIAVVPDGKRSFLVIAPDEKTAAERVAAFKAGKEPTLAQRKDLATLRSLKAVSAGFVSLAAFGAQLQGVARLADRDATKIIDALPHHGRVPMLMDFTVEQRGGVTLRVNGRIPRAVLEDVAAIGPAMMP